MATKIVLTIEDTDFNCEVDYDFCKGYPARTYGLPENCYEGVADDWILNSLTIIDDNNHYNADYLIEILAGSIIDAIQLAESN